MMKKIIATIVSLCLTLGMCCTSAFAAETKVDSTVQNGENTIITANYDGPYAEESNITVYPTVPHRIYVTPSEKGETLFMNITSSGACTIEVYESGSAAASKTINITSGSTPGIALVKSCNGSPYTIRIVCSKTVTVSYKIY